MELNVGDLFKSPYLNRIIAALAIGFGITAYLRPEESWLLVVAIACAAYTLLGIIFWFVSYRKNKKLIKQRNEYMLKQEQEREANAVAEAEFIFERLSLVNQDILRSVVQYGEKSQVRNVRIFRDKQRCFNLISKLQTIYSSDGRLWDRISIEDTFDSTSVIFEPTFFDVVNNSISKQK